MESLICCRPYKFLMLLNLNVTPRATAFDGEAHPRDVTEAALQIASSNAPLGEFAEAENIQ